MLKGSFNVCDSASGMMATGSISVAVMSTPSKGKYCAKKSLETVCVLAPWGHLKTLHCLFRKLVLCPHLSTQTIILNFYEVFP